MLRRLPGLLGRLGGAAGGSAASAASSAAEASVASMASASAPRAAAAGFRSRLFSSETKGAHSVLDEVAQARLKRIKSQLEATGELPVEPPSGGVWGAIRMLWRGALLGATGLGATAAYYTYAYDTKELVSIVKQTRAELKAEEKPNPLRKLWCDGMQRYLVFRHDMESRIKDFTDPATDKLLPDQHPAMKVRGDATGSKTHPSAVMLWCDRASVCARGFLDARNDDWGRSCWRAEMPTCARPSPTSNPCCLARQAVFVSSSYRYRVRRALPAQGAITLVLDLDEVLVWKEWTRQRGWSIYKRPGVQEFLLEMAQYFEIVVYTDEPYTYADPILNKFDPQRVAVMHRLYRTDTQYLDGKHVRDLSKINRDLNHVLMISAKPEVRPNVAGGGNAEGRRKGGAGKDGAREMRCGKWEGRAVDSGGMWMLRASTYVPRCGCGGRSYP